MQNSLAGCIEPKFKLTINGYQSQLSRISIKCSNFRVANTQCTTEL